MDFESLSFGELLYDSNTEVKRLEISNASIMNYLM